MEGPRGGGHCACAALTQLARAWVAGITAIDDLAEAEAAADGPVRAGPGPGPVRAGAGAGAAAPVVRIYTCTNPECLKVR